MKTIIKYSILKLIQLVEKIEYRNIELDEDDLDKKILDSINIDNLKIDTPQGFKPVTNIHKTQPFRIWKLQTESGLKLEGADNHIVFDSLGQEIFIKDLKNGYYIQTRKGLDKVTVLKKTSCKVSMYDVTVDSKEHTFYSNDIVSHNTTTTAAYFAWYMCFHNDRNLAILANKQATAFEIVNKVKDVFKGLPFFLKPGIINIGAGSMRLDNGCYLTSQATTKTAQIGFTIHVLYADEFAHIQNSIARDFWRSVYPTLASSEISQCIISSTPNGDDNVFYEIWDKSQRNLNSFKSIRVDWWEVPGHDDEWAAKMKRDFGEENFEQEFGLTFTRGSSNKLLNSQDFKFIKRIEKDYDFHLLEKSDLDDTLYRNLKWHPDFDPNEDLNPKNNRFILTIDTGEGKDDDEVKDNDYNISNVFTVYPKSIAQLKRLRTDEMSIKNMFRIEQVGLYRDNVKDEENCANVTKAIVFDQLGEEICKVLIEMNFNGKHFLDKFSNHDNYYDDLILSTYHTKPIPGEKPPRKKPGFKVTSDKDTFCKLGKRLIRNKTIIINEFETAKEFKTFGKVKGKWKGMGAHDDAAMSVLNIARLYEDLSYEDWLYDYLDEMTDSPEKRLINELIERYEETTDIDDTMFSALYSDNDMSSIERTMRLLDKQQNSMNNMSYRPKYTNI